MFLSFWTVTDIWRSFQQLLAHLEKEQDANSGRAQRAASSPDNVLSQEAAIAQLPCPQLDSHDGKDVDDEEVEDENIYEHRHHV